jgi:hypothetical protein
MSKSVTAQWIPTRMPVVRQNGIAVMGSKVWSWTDAPDDWKDAGRIANC